MEILDQNERKADYPIDPIYIKRWSPRAFANKQVADEDLYSLFEAARWAPSAGNMQPWRYIFARTEKDRKKFLSFLNEGNQIWCKDVPVLVALAVEKVRENGKENPYAAFDAGTSWGFLALEATRRGLVTHAMGGFDREKAKKALNLSDRYEVQAMIAIGYQGDKNLLDDALKEREKPSQRNKVSSFVFEGSYK